MSGVESGDDRLSKNEFAELIQHLPVTEMLLIEYRTNNSWRKLFYRRTVNIIQFHCRLCNSRASCFKNLIAHINGRRHVLLMGTVVGLYHPAYTYPKDKVADQSDTVLASNKDDGKTTSKKKKQDIVATKDVVVTTAKNKEQNGSNAKNEEVPEKVPGKIESTGKATKLVKNPVAFSKCELSSKTENIAEGHVAPTVIVIDDGPEEKPQYQTDKIIIPTVNKNRSSKEAQNISPEMESPLFSTKTYSSNPCDDDIRGILGVEYVIKLITKNKGSSARYECGLCELVLDAFAMQRHLEGYNHRMKFCEKHFPTAIRHYRQYMQGIPEHDLFKVMTPVLAKLAVAIEKHHGRNLPYECYESDFTLHRHDILAKAYSCRHASEQYGPTFTHVIDSNEIDKYINERHKYAPPTFSRSAIFDNKLGKDNDLRGSSQLNGRSGSAKISIQKDRHRHVIRDNNKTLVDEVSRTNKLSESSFNTQLMPSNNFIDYSMPNPINMENMTFKKVFQPLNMTESFVPTPGTNNFPSNNMMESFIPNSGYNYNTQPQTNFNSYNDQGRSVDDQKYNNMVDEFLRGTLKGTHGNTSRKRSTHSSHSSGPLPKRHNVEDLQQSRDGRLVEQEIATLDGEFRKYRQDPETYPNYNDDWQKYWKRRKDELIAAGKDHRNYNYQPEWVKFIKERIENVYREKLETIKVKSQKHNVSNYISAAGINNTAVNKPNNMTDNNFKPEADHSQVVSVLRLMAALEENLGSLGPKIITLLSKALQLEKTNRGEFSNSLLNDENCSVIETAKEKFKGLLITGIVEGSKQRAMKRAVEEAESLLTSTQQLRALNQSQRVSAIISEPQRKPQAQPVPTIEDILKLLRAHSDHK